MSEQDQTETKSGVGVSGVVGGAAGGVGTYLGINKFVGDSGITKALQRSEKATDRYKASTEKLIKDDATNAFKQTESALTNLKGVKSADTVRSVQFVANEGGKGFTGHVKLAAVEGQAGERIFKLHNIAKLPEGFTAGTAVTDQTALKTFIEGEKAPLAGLLQQAEKTLASGIRSAGGMNTAFKNAGGMGKAGIVLGTVAGVAAGAKVLHAVFGGKNTNKVEAERTATPEQAAGAARA